MWCWGFGLDCFLVLVFGFRVKGFTVASKAAMARDLATAFARVHAGGYREIHICDNLLKAAALPQNEHLGKLIDEFTTHRNDIPPFAKEMDLDFLIADFEKRFRRGQAWVFPHRSV